MLFGLINAPTTFQGYINKVQVEKIDICMIVYFHDILIYIESEGKKYVQTVWLIL